MDLGLDLVRVKGRTSRPIAATQVRELIEADLALLATERGTKPVPITELRARHHALARALAAGMTQNEAAACTGYSVSRVSILCSDPSFRELLEFYRSEVRGNFDAGLEMMKVGHVVAVNELVDRIAETPEAVETPDLIKAIATFSDRVGLGPQSKSTNVNVNVDISSRLDAARRRAGLIEGVALPPTLEPEEPGA